MLRSLTTWALTVGLLVPTSFVSAFAPDDPELGQQWYLSKIKAEEAWEHTQGDRRVIVAVLDTGTDLTHEDLVDNLFVNEGEVAGDGKDNDGNGYVDDVHGWDFFDDDSDPSYTREFGNTVGAHHGTVVAGIIGAVGDNETGISGVSWNVQILPIRVLNESGDGSITKITEAIRYATFMGADVVNMSFVGSFTSKGLDQALQAAYDQDVVLVAAMGNESDDLDRMPLYPVCSKGTGADNIVIGVVSSNAEDERSDFSNYGAGCADIAAPGEEFFAAQVGDLAKAYGGGWSGTSMSAPVVSGAAALIKAVYPHATSDEVRIALQLAVDPLVGKAPSRRIGALGSGRINLARAFELLPMLVKDPRPFESEQEAEQGTPTVTDFYAHPIVLGAWKGSKPLVRVMRRPSEAIDWLAYGEGFTGGVDVAVGNLDGSDRDEIVTAPGVGGGPHVRVFDEFGALSSQFFAYDASVTGGLRVAVGDTDIDSDTLPEIVVLPRSGSRVLRQFLPSGVLVGSWEIPEEIVDPRLTMADVDGNGEDEIIIANGVGAQPRVWVFEYDGRLINSFLAYGETFDRGVHVSATPSGGRDAIVTGTGAGGGPQVRALSILGVLVGQFFAFNEADRNGVDVSGWSPSVGTNHILTLSLNDGHLELRAFTLQGVPVGVIGDVSDFGKSASIAAGQ